MPRKSTIPISQRINPSGQGRDPRTLRKPQEENTSRSSRSQTSTPKPIQKASQNQSLASPSDLGQNQSLPLQSLASPSDLSPSKSQGRVVVRPNPFRPKNLFERIDLAFGGRLPGGPTREQALSNRLFEQRRINPLKAALAQEEVIIAKQIASSKREEDFAETNFFERLFQPTERAVDDTRNLQTQFDQAEQQFNLRNEAEDLGFSIPGSGSPGFFDKITSASKSLITPAIIVIGGLVLFNITKKR